MKNNFNESVEIILECEGGFVNNINDPGGMTNHGITRRVYEQYIGGYVNENEMRNMPIDDAKKIYKLNYWNLVKGDHLPSGVDLCVFDFAVNAGVNRSVKTMQMNIGTKEDGIVGVNTLGMINSLSDDEIIKLINDICDDREIFYRSLKTFEVFGKGWMNRLNKIKDICLSKWIPPYPSN